MDDHKVIEELVKQAVVGVLRKDMVLWGSTWADDGRWMIDMFDAPAQGRETITGIFGDIMERFTFVSMSSFVTDIAVNGDQATGKAYCQEWMFPKSGGTKLLCGCFHDEYVKRDQRWLFQSRTYETLHRANVVEPSAGRKA